MEKKKIFLSLALIFFLVSFGIFFDFAPFFNQKIENLNQKFNLKVPKIPEIPFKLGLDLQGGVYLLYQADLSQLEKKEWENAMRGLRDVIERRINLFGVKEPSVQVLKTAQGYRLMVEIAGVIDPEKAIEMIGKTPFLEFREKEKDSFKPTKLTGRYLKKAQLAFDPTTGEPIVILEFDKEGAKIFEKLTEKNVGKPLAIYIDQVLISAPIVQEKISGGRATITGKFTLKEAKQLAQNLSAGALPVPIHLISQQQIGPTLGEISLKKSLKAGLFGFLAIALFMICFYRLPGLISILSLSFYAILTLFLFKLFGVTLTLAAIAGFLLSVGMAIDANILVFSRLKEEMKEKEKIRDCLREAFLRAWPSIRDGNLTTLMVALILFSFGTSFVKGFALTLSLGILVSIFSAMFVTRVLLEIFSRTKFAKIKLLWG